MDGHLVPRASKRGKLTGDELKELQSLHDVIEHVGCFGSRDVLRASQLERRASDAQLMKICAAHYQDVL